MFKIRLRIELREEWIPYYQNSRKGRIWKILGDYYSRIFFKLHLCLSRESRISMSSYTSYKFHCRDWELVEDNSYMERHTSPNMALWRIRRPWPDAPSENDPKRRDRFLIGQVAQSAGLSAGVSVSLHEQPALSAGLTMPSHSSPQQPCTPYSV